jgi:hypothetical protein
MPFSARGGFLHQPAGAPPADTIWYDINGSDWLSTASGFTGGTTTGGSRTVTYFNTSLASRSAVLHPNGNIYCAPRNSGSGMLEYDPVNDVSTNLTYGALAGLNSTGQAYFHSACLTESGNILCIPFNYTKIVQVDPVAQTATEFGTFTGTVKWSGGVLASNGNVYCTPQNYNGVLEIDPVNETTTVKTYSIGMSGSTKWWGGYRSPKTDKIYMPPLRFGSVLVISADGQSATTETYGQTFSTGANQHYGACGDMYGNVVLVRGDGPDTKVINPDSNTAFTVATNVSYGGVTGADGNVYTLSKGTTTQKIDLSAGDTSPGVTIVDYDTGNKMAATTALDNITYMFRDGSSSDVQTLDTTGNAANVSNGANIILSPYFSTSKI